MESKMHLIYLYMFDLVGKLQSISLMMTKMTMMFFRHVFRSLIFFPIIQGTFQERLQVVWTKEFSRAIIHENLIWVFPKIGVRSTPTWMVYFMENPIKIDCRYPAKTDPRDEVGIFS